MSAIGYGSNATGGTDPFVVTSLADSGSGTLRDALSVEGRLITFGVSGEIKLKSSLVIKSNTTIEGNRINLLRNGFHGIVGAIPLINVIIRGIDFHTPYTSGSPCWMPKDPIATKVCGNGIAIDGKSGIPNQNYNIWIDDCTFIRSGAKCITLWDGTTNVTVSNCRMYSSFFGLLAGNTHGGPKLPSKITVYRCLFSGIRRRQPKCSEGVMMHAFNNVIENWGSTVDDYGSAAGLQGQMLLEKNIFDPGPKGNKAKAYTAGDDDHGGVQYYGYLKAVGNSMLGGSKGIQYKPTSVFKPSYAYTAEMPTTALRNSVTQG